MQPFRDLGFARVDTDREARQGAPEAILAEGKTPDEIEAIAPRAARRAARAACWSPAPTTRRAAALRARRAGRRGGRAGAARVGGAQRAGGARAGDDRVGRDVATGRS